MDPLKRKLAASVGSTEIKVRIFNFNVLYPWTMTLYIVVLNYKKLCIQMYSFLSHVLGANKIL